MRAPLFVSGQGERTEHLPVPSALWRGWFHHTPGYRLSYSRQHLSWTQPEKGSLQIHTKIVIHHKENSTVWSNVIYTLSPLLSESSSAVPLLPGAGPDRHVPTEQQQPVPGVLQEPTPRVPAEGLVCVAVNRRPHAVPLHKGPNDSNKKRNSTTQETLFFVMCLSVFTF